MALIEILKDRNTQYVDVRTKTEFDAGHVTGALNIPLDQFQRRYHEINALGKSPVVLYCRSGNRSGQAVAYLIQKGIKNVYNGGSIEDLQFYLN